MVWWVFWLGLGCFLARLDVLYQFAFNTTNFKPPDLPTQPLKPDPTPIVAPDTVPIASPNPAPITSPNSPPNSSGRVWQYSKGARCDEKDAIVTLSNKEMNQRSFEPSSLALVWVVHQPTSITPQAQQVLRRCGVVVIKNGVQLAQIEAFRQEIESLLAPLLESRKRFLECLSVKDGWLGFVKCWNRRFESIWAWSNCGKNVGIHWKKISPLVGQTSFLQSYCFLMVIVETGPSLIATLPRFSIPREERWTHRPPVSFGCTFQRFRGFFGVLP